MRIASIVRNSLPVALFLGLLFFPKNSFAMTLPPRIEYDGLVIEQPLSFSDEAKNDATLLTLAFGEAKKEMQNTEPVALNKSDNTEILLETTTPSPIAKATINPTTNASKKLARVIITSTPTKSVPTPKTEKPTPTIKQVQASPIPTPTSIPTSTPQLQATPQLSNGGLNADTLFSMSNRYRQAKGLSAFQKDDRSCQLAASRAPEIAAEIEQGHMHSGLANRNLPYWNTENIITMRNEEEAFNWWINDTIHREQIEGNFTYSCVACEGNACAQEFTNFQSK